MAVTHIADISYRFNITGKNESGETILFLNNLFDSFESWSQVLPYFNQSHYRFLRLDYRGQWYTEAGKKALTFESQVQDICFLLDQLDLDRVHIVGQGLGAEIGLWFALQYPDRIISLSALSALASMDDVQYQTCQRWRRLVSNSLDKQHSVRRVNDTSSSELLYEQLSQDRFGDDYLINSLELLRENATLFEQRLTTNILMGFIHLIDQKCRLQRSERLSEHLGEIYTPTLILNGSQDKFSSPRSGAIMSRALPLAKQVIVPGAGHELVHEKNVIVGAQLAAFIDQYSMSQEPYQPEIKGYYGMDQLFGVG